MWGYKNYIPTAYGITDKLIDYCWPIGILCGIVFLITLTITKPEEWLTWLFTSLFVAWGSPIAIILPVYLLEQFIWCIFHPKKVYKIFLKMVAIVLILFLSGWLSYQIPRGVATCFANTDYSFWECCYVSESPNATKFHYTDKCSNLKRTTYEIEQYDIEYAEDMDYEPCQACLRQSKKYQFDVFAPLLFIPMLVFIFWLIFRIINMLPKYKLRSPIVKR